MTKQSAKKIAALIVFGLAVFAIAGLAFIGKASASAPIVETRSATDISDESAQLNGYLFTGGEDTTYWFEYGTSRNNLNRDTSERDVDDRGGRVTVSNTIQNGLSEDTTYYFRLVAENRDGIDRGEILSFRTDDDGDFYDDFNKPVVHTVSVDVRSGGEFATFTGRVDPQDSSTLVWFRYGPSSGSLYFMTSAEWVSGDRTRTFSQRTMRLTPGTTYYYQAVAENRDGTDYGEILHFSTSGNDNGGGQDNFLAPSVSTGAATVTGRNSATLQAQVNPNGNLSSVWFEYGRTASLGSATTRDPAGSGTASAQYSVNLSGLSAGTTYFYRAVAQNSSGSNRGVILNFRTQGTPPAPVTPGGDGGNVPPPPISVVTSTPIGAPGCFTVSPALNSAQLKAGDDFAYSVTYRNNCDQTLSSGSLQITLPVATEFAGTNLAFLSRDANVITYNLGIIAPNFQSSVTVNGKVRSQVATGDNLIFQANVTFTDPRGTLQNASGFLSATVVDSDSAGDSGTSTLGASAAEALSGLFQSGWFWLVLFLILLALFVFWLATRRRDGEDDDEGIEEEAQGH